ncbi:putative disease resistance protein [Camellia lanceoleosa]|uniref:Disease resistance protein n=1 Tax=Camellia lanceoleosa TaxID=1840588 RepID=A0ACC0GIY8_9ERIC|nr:putative disease resistance protein [Camellia lanceoleosa]
MNIHCPCCKKEPVHKFLRFQTLEIALKEIAPGECFDIVLLLRCGFDMLPVFLDGNRIGREILNYFLQSKLDLQVLAVFNPTFKSLPRSLSDMDNLDVLVLRSCHFLRKIDSILELRTLIALEISGSNILEKIEDDFFKSMPRLQSLNLFGLRIESLPSSVYHLSELRWLILRGCSRLRKLDSLRHLRNLVVLDLHGATYLQHI